MAMKGGRKRVEQKRKRGFRLPPYMESREPEDRGPLHDFIMSVAGEVDYQTALREFQAEWCDHPRSSRRVLAVISAPTEDRHEYEILCEVCGLIRKRQGRAPVHANR